MAGTAIVDVLFGRQSPSGRLPFTWPSEETDVAPIEDYTMHGRTYRYNQVNSAWPFGFGLSYTSFSYNLPRGPRKVAPCETVTFSVEVFNTGAMTSGEVVQGYLRWQHLKPPVETPALSLFDFRKLTLQPSQKLQVELVLTPRRMAVLTEPMCGLVVPTAGVRLLGSALANVTAATADACCQLCAQKESCEAWSHHE